MRIHRLLPVLCLLGSAACTGAEILGPEPAPAAVPQLAVQAAAEAAEARELEPVEMLESCLQIQIIQIDPPPQPLTSR